MNIHKSLYFIRLTIVIFTTICSMSLAASKITKPKPLDWKWKKSEIRDMKKDIDKVKEVEKGVFEFEGENWKVRTYHTPRFTVQVAKYMELFTDVFQKAFLFKADYGFKSKPLIIIFPNHAAYISGMKAPEGSGGLFRVRWDGNGENETLTLGTYYQTSQKEPDFDSKANLGTIQHEATHCLFQKLFGPKNIPAWLTEGAATYYEAWDLRQPVTDTGDNKKDIKARAVRRTHSDGLPMMQRLTINKGGALPRLDYLVTLGVSVDWNIDNMGNETRYHYAIAETFIDYLMSSRKRRPFLFKVIERLYNGEKVIITPQEQLEHEEDWLRFIDDNWKVPFSGALIKARRDELEQRVKDAETANKEKTAEAK